MGWRDAKQTGLEDCKHLDMSVLRQTARRSSGRAHVQWIMRPHNFPLPIIATLAPAHCHHTGWVAGEACGVPLAALAPPAPVPQRAARPAAAPPAAAVRPGRAQWGNAWPSGPWWAAWRPQTRRAHPAERLACLALQQVTVVKWERCAVRFGAAEAWIERRAAHAGACCGTAGGPKAAPAACLGLFGKHASGFHRLSRRQRCAGACSALWRRHPAPGAR